jgi:hypothetical protein
MKDHDLHLLDFAASILPLLMLFCLAAMGLTTKTGVFVALLLLFACSYLCLHSTDRRRSARRAEEDSHTGRH